MSASAAFNAIDANHDGFITQAEFAGMGGQPQFAQPAMGMTYAAAPTVMMQQAPQVMNYAAPQQMAYAQPASGFDMIDRNHDGVITQAEFAGATTYGAPQVQYGAPQVQYGAPQVQYAAPQPVMNYAAPPQMAYSQPAQAFDMMDRNHDGVITQAEFAGQTTYGAPQMQYAAATQVMTYAAPPQIAYQQQSAFDTMDRNHDGVITQAEFAGGAMQYAPQQVSYSPPPLPIAQPLQLGPPVVISVNNLPLQRLPEAPQSQTRGAPVRTGIISGTRQLPFNCPPLPEPVIPQYQQTPPQQFVQPPMQASYQPPMQAQAFDMMDRNHDGVVTRAEFAGATQVATYAPQATQVMTYAAQPQMAYAQPPTAFDMIDRNHDGMITQAELAGATQYGAPQMQYGAPQVQFGAPQTQFAAPQQVMNYAAPQTAYAQPQTAFDMLDRNHDGMITQAEFVGATTYGAPQVQYAAPQVQFGAPPTQYAAAPQQVMNYAAPQTAYAQPQSAFDMLDRNHDGMITQAEFVGSTVPQYAAPPTMYAAPQTMMQAPPPTYAQPGTVYG